MLQPVSVVFKNLVVVQEFDRLEFMAMTKLSDTEWTPSLTKLVDRLIAHYENHYRVESDLIKGNNVQVLEDAFLWFGGWRPSMSFHLIDFKPGLVLGARLTELLKGVSLTEFTDILPNQLARVGELRRQTIKEESELTQSVTPNKRGFGEVFGKADNLRLRTLKDLVQILSPIQAVQLFIPVAQLHLKVQQWGKTKQAHHQHHITRSGGSGGGGLMEDFGKFFEMWLGEQERDLEVLRSAAKAYTESTQSQDEVTRDVVSRILCHYETYYRVKSESVKKNVYQMLTPAWRSLLEHAYLWIGGWRPSMAFHLLYTVVGLQFEARFGELMQGLLRTDDLAALSPSQLSRVDELQMHTIGVERGLTETLASFQETVADLPTVRLSKRDAVIERESESRTWGRVEAESVAERIEGTLGIEEDKLKEIFGKADDLRMKTLKNVVDILNPIQAVHFLIAAAELHLKVHEWGKTKDAQALLR